MVDTTQIRQSKTIQQQTGVTFHIATRLLPRRVRHATYVLYAFFRLLMRSLTIRRDHLQRNSGRNWSTFVQRHSASESDRPVVRAFADVRREYGIAGVDVNAFIDAMVTDITNPDTTHTQTLKRMAPDLCSKEEYSSVNTPEDKWFETLQQERPTASNGSCSPLWNRDPVRKDADMREYSLIEEFCN